MRSCGRFPSHVEAFAPTPGGTVFAVDDRDGYVMRLCSDRSPYERYPGWEREPLTVPMHS